MATKLQHRNVYDWGQTGPDNIAELRQKHYVDLSDCVKSDECYVGDVIML